MILDNDNSIEFTEVVNDPDRESGIAAQAFSLSARAGKEIAIHFAAAMIPSSDVQDAPESDFPDVEFMLSVEQFRELHDMFNEFNNKLFLEGL